MRTKWRWLIVPAVLVGVGFFLRAQEPGEPRKTGKVLLLKSGFAMEGDVEQIGSQMCVRNGKSEVWIAADKAMRLSPDWLDAYAFMQTLIQSDSAGDRVKLARWCHLHRLNEEALEQAHAALRLEADHADAKQIVVMLERARAEPAPKTVVQAPAPVRINEPTPTVDVTAETFIAFAAKVQPILMNLCASCHANDATGKFRLERVSAASNKVATQRNLAAVLEHIDLDRPAISPLLVQAITPHGREPLPAIRDRSAKPFQNMQEWIVDTVKKNPQFKDYRGLRKPTPAKAEPEPKKSAFSSGGAMAPMPGAEVISTQTPRIEWTSVKSQPVQQAHTPTPAAERDWCDPGHFNDWAHPKNMGKR